jgi:superfamily I DNA/RNA helicase
MESLLQYAVEQEEDSIYPVDTAMKTLFELFLLIENCPIDTLVEKLAGKLQIEEKHPATTELTRCIEFQRLESAQELQEYLEWMVEFNDETKIEYNTTPNKVNLMTAHSSKGKEFPAVIILQAEDFKASEEERRLLYVAMTRAKKTLFLLESPYQKCEMMHEIEYEVVTTCLA